MPEAAGSVERSAVLPGAAGSAAEAGGAEAAAACGDAAEPVAGAARGGALAGRFYFALGLSLQTFLWFLLFVAIVVAVAVGDKLTEFRYVGF